MTAAYHKKFVFHIENNGTQSAYDLSNRFPAARWELLLFLHTYRFVAQNQIQGHPSTIKNKIVFDFSFS